MNVAVSLTVNGQRHDHEVDPRQLLVHFLRDSLGLTGTKVGCDTSQCGSCTVLVDGVAVKACTCLTAQADGARSRPSKAWPRPARCTPSRRRSGTSTACSAASARRGWCSPRTSCCARTRTPRPRRFATGSRATSAAAPATRTSSAPCRRRLKPWEVRSERPRLRIGHPPARGPAPAHRHRHLHRRHRAAGPGARRHAAQPARARAHQEPRHVEGCEGAGRAGRLHREGHRGRPQTHAVRMAGAERGPEGGRVPGDGEGHRALRRRHRRGRRRAVALPGLRRARAHRRRLRAAARGGGSAEGHRQGRTAAARHCARQPGVPLDRRRRRRRTPRSRRQTPSS
jgi:hypothetical protein